MSACASPKRVACATPTKACVHQLAPVCEDPETDVLVGYLSERRIIRERAN